MRILFTLFVCLLTSLGIAQKLDHVQGQMIVQVQETGSIDHITDHYSNHFRSAVSVQKILSKRLGIYLIAFDFTRVHEGELLTKLRNDRNVIVAQYDHITTNRQQPDDPLFADQWQWLNAGQTGGISDADIDADEAWDVTRGGLTALGDTIVVAIIDDGLDYNHPDIKSNAWINHHEIADNGIDDDANGYVDDIYGWNVFSESPDVLNQGHGLSVAGMIGAVGNNGVGITGINWNVKLMTIVGSSPESAAIASYAYALEQRILYHETHGAKGAFVVATNSSWGIDYGQPADAPLWCAFYDTLGVHGILSAAATANNPDDIDIVGDLPTACTSEYLFSVTALNSSNERTFSAFGLEHVDFGAPGENIFTTQSNDGYGHTSGTSFASPVAAGLVALLYASPCEGIAELARSNPGAAAEFIRDIMFEGVEPVSTLQGITKYGGALNAGNSMALLMNICSDCPTPFSITSDVISDTEVNISWQTLDTVDAVNARYKPVSEINWDTLFDVTDPLELNDLTGCTDYIIEFESVCGDTATGFQNGHEFTTAGCCELPATITATPADNSFNVSWSHVLAAQFYLIQWRPLGATEWFEEVTSLDEVTIDNLEQCTYYEFRLRTNCDSTITGFSEIILLRTGNCGNCIDLPYCDAGSDDFSEEFIDSISIGDLVNQSGVNNGYILFENFDASYLAGATYPVGLRPGFGQNETFDEQFRIWLDANQNGLFEEDELLLDTVLVQDEEILIGDITIPADALEGATRMRVSMSFFDPPFNANQDPCGSIDFGEIEDYCVSVIRQDCPRVDTVQFDAVTFTSAFMYWPSADGAIAYTYRYRAVGETMYTELATVDTTANLDALMKCTTYEVQIRTVCFEDTTAYDTVYLLETDCDVAVDEVDPLLSAFEVYPNPVTDYATVRLQSLTSDEHTIMIYNMQGQRIFEDKFYAEENQRKEYKLDKFENYPPGLLMIIIEKDGKTASRKLVKI